MSKEACPCGTDRNYDDCCGAIHNGLSVAETAEQLMRSRYSAFVKELDNYLLQSWHPDYRPPSINFDPATKWLGLKIKHTEKGRSQDLEGRVHFIARYKIAGKAERIEENSTFIRHQGRWVYRDGQ